MAAFTAIEELNKCKSLLVKSKKSISLEFVILLLSSNGNVVYTNVDCPSVLILILPKSPNVTSFKLSLIPIGASELEIRVLKRMSEWPIWLEVVPLLAKLMAAFIYQNEL